MLQCLTERSLNYYINILSVATGNKKKYFSQKFQFSLPTRDNNVLILSLFFHVNISQNLHDILPMARNAGNLSTFYTWLRRTCFEWRWFSSLFFLTVEFIPRKRGAIPLKWVILTRIYLHSYKYYWLATLTRDTSCI